MSNWKDVVGYEGRYQVSDKGEVKSLPNKRRKTELIIKAHTNVKSGHLQVNLTDTGPDGKWRQRMFYVHTLVLTAFAGFAPAGMEALHDDGNPANNRLGNLMWGTVKQNMADRKRHGTDNAGERNGQSKLTETQVKQIKERLAKGEKVVKLAKEYGVTHGAIGHIKHGRQWSHV